MSWLAIMALLGRAPRQLWFGLGAALLLLGLFAWHQHHAHNAIKAAYAKGKADEGSRIAAKALEIATKARLIADELRRKNDEANRHISDNANTMRVSGPGKAACLSTATPSPSGRVTPARPTNVALAPMPGTGGADLIALPFIDTIAFAERHDKCLAEVKTWREDKRRQEEEWARANGGSH